MITATIPNGPTLEYDESSEVQKDMHEAITSGATYEPGTWHTFHRILRPGDVYADVGAHVGTFACLAAHLVGSGGQVHAFEPDKKNRMALIGNIARNRFPNVGITIHQHPVTDRSGPVTFHRCADNDGGHALYNPGDFPSNPLTRAKPRRQLLQATTLDQALAQIPSLRLLKIDVEGAESNVIRGAQETIAKHRPAIITEINAFGLEAMGSDQYRLRALIRQHGYKEYGIQDSAPWYVPIKPTEHCQPETVSSTGQRMLIAFNMIFTPQEWPDL